MTEPDYSSGYHPFLMMVSSRYVKRRIRHIIENCPSLGNLEQATVSKIAEQVASYSRTVRWFAVFIFGFYALFTYVILGVQEKSLPYFTLINFVATGVLAFLAAFLFNFLLRTHYEQLAMLRLLGAVRVIDMNVLHWHDSRFRWNVAKLIERSARAIESIPSGWTRIAPSTRRELFEMSHRKAQVIRDLELLAIAPEHSSRSRVTVQLASSLGFIAEGQWHKLPETEYKRIQSRLLIAIEISCALLAIAGAVVLIVLASKIGSAATLAAPILIAIAAGLLNAAGVPLNIIEIYRAAAETTTSGEKTSS